MSSDGNCPSIHSASIDEIHQIPMKDIARPLPSVLDESKVQSMMDTIEVISRIQSSAVNENDASLLSGHAL